MAYVLDLYQLISNSTKNICHFYINMQNKIALITGATNGIGFDISKSLLEQNIHVIAVGRNEKKLDVLNEFATSNNYKLTISKLDLQIPSQITELSNIITKRFKKLDILIANAAILGEVTPLNQYSTKTWQEVLFTNLTANWLLIRNFDYLLKQAKTPQIIFSACKMSQKNNAYWGAYLTSKTGLLKLAQIYAEENKTTNLKVNIVDPGPCNTSLRHRAFPGEDKSTISTTNFVSNIFLHCLCNNNIENGDFLYYDNEKQIQKTKKLPW